MKLIITVACVACATMSSGAFAQEEKIMLWPEGKMPDAQAHQHVPYMVWHTPKTLKTKSVMIAVSGGGYGGNGISGFEVAPMRDYALAHGMTVVTMLYRTPRPKGFEKHVTAWQDAQRTVRLVRKLAKERGLNPDSIGFTGCSAGGHLALVTAVSSQTPAYAPVDEIDKLPCNLNWAIPVYPAYILSDGFDQKNLKKGNDLSVTFAPELKFDAATPPMCFFHGDTDWWSAMGSIRAYHKLRTMGIPAEVHALALETHCFQSDPRPGTPADIWKDIAWAWLVSLDVVTEHPATWKKGWTSLFPLWAKKPLAKLADFEPGAWRQTSWGNAQLTADKDSPLWLKEDYEDFILDFEYKLDKGAESGVILRASDRKNWASSSAMVKLEQANAAAKPTGEWNRMTIWVEGKSVRVTVNGKPCADQVNTSGLSARGSVGFIGKRGAHVYFRNVKFKDTSAYIPEPKPIKTDIEVTALYYPGTEHMPEWDMVAQTLPKIRPLLGWYDEGHPENIDWQIKWAVEHGISSFCVDWYWNRGEQRLDHWVKGFYKAKFRKYFKWYIMYANHNEPGAHSTADQIAVTKWWLDHYFKTPEYYKIDGKPVVVYWDYYRLDRDFIAEAKAKGETLQRGEGVKRAFAISERMAREAGLPGICWINMNNAWKHTAKETELFKGMGFTAQMSYNLGGRGPYYMAPESRLVTDTPEHSSYDLMIAAAKALWKNADVYPSLPFWPLLPTGWNDLPRSFHRACVTFDRTPEKFREVCTDAREFCLKRGLKRVVIAPLNEWQEGSYIEPNEEYGFRMYDALRDVFGVKPPEGWPKNETPQSTGRANPQFPPMFFSPVQRWTFDNSTEGWYRQPYGSPNTLAKNGCLWFIISRENFNFNIRQRLVPFAAAKYKKFRLRMKVTPNVHYGLGKKKDRKLELRLKWGTKDAPIIKSDLSFDDKNIATAPVIPDGEFHEYTLDVAANPGWKDEVNELWFEAANIQHAIAEIDWMQFAADEPRTATTVK